MTLPDVAQIKGPICTSYGLAVIGASIFAIHLERKIPSSLDKSKHEQLSWNIMYCHYLIVTGGYMLVQYITDDKPNAEGGLKRILKWLGSMCGAVLGPKLVKYDSILKIFMCLIFGLEIISIFVLLLVLYYQGKLRRVACISCGFAVVGILLQMKFVKSEKNYINAMICHLIVGVSIVIAVKLAGYRRL